MEERELLLGSCGRRGSGGIMRRSEGRSEAPPSNLSGACGLVKWLTRRLYTPKISGSSPEPATRRKSGLHADGYSHRNVRLVDRCVR